MIDTDIMTELRGLADISVAAFTILVLGFVLTRVLVAWIQRRKATSEHLQIDLIPILENNTKALTELSILITSQSALLQEQARTMADMRVEMARLQAATQA